MGLTRQQIITLGILISGTFITVLNGTLVTPALPTIMEEMSVDASTVQWLTTGFTLVNAIMVPITAYLTDRFSTRSLFIVSMISFALGTALAGWGVNFTVLLIGRMIQAAGAGVLMPMVMTVMLLTFPLERRGVAMGWYSVIIAFAPAVGPTIAGIIIDNASWHFMFFAVAALALIDTVLAIIFLQKVKDGNRDVPPLDKPSVLLSTLGFGGALYGFSAIGTYGPLSPIAIVPIVIGAIIIVVFFRRQLRLETPMLRVDVLKNRRFTVGTIIAMIVQAAIMANAVLIPIYVQDLSGHSATVSGLVLLPGAVIMGIMGPVAGRIFDKSGPRSMTLIGTVLLAAGTAFLAVFLNVETSMVVLASVIAIRNFAMSLVNMPITTWGMNALDDRVINHGNAVNNTLRQMAGSLGTAIVTSVYSMVGHTNAATLGEKQASMLGINAAFGVQVLLCLAAAVLVFAMVKKRPGDARNADPSHKRRNAVETIMHRDVYTVPSNATVADAVNMFVTKGISAVPIVNEKGAVCGVISDGDVLRALSYRGKTYVDPIVLIMNSGIEKNAGFDEKLDDVMNLNVMSLCTMGVITVDAHANFAEICRVMGENHLKKVPVVEDDGHIVGVINRSDITQYAMRTYMNRRSNTANEEPAPAND